VVSRSALARSEAPLDTLERLTRASATGELICATDDLEVHVYLQEGRVAWATSSAARFAFSRDLIERTGVDPETLKELVEDCRRNRRPLGETLVEWKLASLEDVRSSLRLQVTHALQSLPGHPSTPTLFLERGAGYLTYDRALTFALEEVLVREAPSPGPDARALLRQVLDAVPDARWI
jgi:hypothetical protein